ncbi:MAG: C10 family peptidase, partial [Muribaculaceae bacterium]
VTESGSYDPETGSEVEPFQEYMDNAVNTLASNYVKEGIELPILMREVMFVDTTYTYAVEPLANYYWGQTGYEGKYCSNKYSGCGPLSMAMTMAYFGHPTSFAFSAGDNSTVSLNWQDIRQHNAFYDVYNGNVFIDCVDNVPQIAKESLGKLCRQIGKVAGSSYIVGDTPTPYSNFISTLRNFGYTVSNKINYYSGAEGDYLGHNYLMIACASREPDKSHAWVIDGYKYVHYERWRYERDNDPRMLQPGEWELISHSHTVNYYAHFNWGFRGYYNGYFLSTRWQTENGVEYDFQHAIVDSLHYDIDKQFITITR